MIVDWPVGTVGGADLDVNTTAGEVVMIADLCLYLYGLDGANMPGKW